MDLELYSLMKTIKNLLDFDPMNYKEKPFKRRIRVRMRALGFETYKEYEEYLKNNIEEQIKLKDTLTINVSKFFRNLEVFEIIKDEIIPKIKEPVRCWSAGCSTGEEPYTIAIILKELGKEGRIIGTDIDTDALKKAREGVYTIFSMDEIPYQYIKKYFDEKDGKYIIKDFIKNYVTFLELDFKDIEKFTMKFDIILCRNVLIYLTKEFQEKLITRFYELLDEGGFLILGMAETLGIGKYEYFLPYKLKERIYRKNG